MLWGEGAKESEDKKKKTHSSGKRTRKWLKYTNH